MDSLVYVITGKEDSLVSSRCEQLLDSLIEPSQRATGFFNADPDSTSATEILDELRTAPFLTDTRVVAVKQAEDFITKNRELLDRKACFNCKNMEIEHKAGQKTTKHR